MNLVLSGGGIKGAYQAGAILELSRHITPTKFYGTSVGALNAAFLDTCITSKRMTFGEAAAALVKFYRDKVSSPKAIMKHRFVWEIAYDTFRGKAPALYSMKPLKKLIEQYRTNAPNTAACIVGIFSGKVKYVWNPDAEVLLASSAIPFLMEPVYINGEPYYDGGLRDITPNIDTSEETVAVVTHPKEIPYIQINTGNPFELAERLLDIAFNEHMNSDLIGFNKVIRPDVPLDVSLARFTRDDVEWMIQKGIVEAWKQF